MELITNKDLSKVLGRLTSIDAGSILIMLENSKPNTRENMDRHFSKLFSIIEEDGYDPHDEDSVEELYQKIKDCYIEWIDGKLFAKSIHLTMEQYSVCQSYYKGMPGKTLLCLEGTKNLIRHYV